MMNGLLFLLSLGAGRAEDGYSPTPRPARLSPRPTRWTGTPRPTLFPPTTTTTPSPYCDYGMRQFCDAGEFCSFQHSPAYGVCWSCSKMASERACESLPRNIEDDDLGDEYATEGYTEGVVDCLRRCFAGTRGEVWTFDVEPEVGGAGAVRWLNERTPCETNRDCDGAEVCYEVIKEIYMEDADACNGYAGGCHCRLGAMLVENLLVNGGPDIASMEGWDDVVDGGGGWKVSLDEGAFQTSYQPCTRRQTVALKVEGKVDAALLDSGAVAVHVHEEVRQFLKVDKYFVRALLCVDRSCNTEISRWEPCKDKHQEEAYQWCETRLEDEDAWRPLDHVFGGAEVAGARYLIFEDGGIDSEYYHGWYGPRFRNAKVSLHAEPEPKCDDSCEWSFDGVCDDGTASYDDDDYDDDYAAEPTCPLGTDCTDCARAVRPIDPRPAVECDNSCEFARDGFCDDSRTNGYCALGTDCQDCGPVGASNFSTYDDDKWWDDDSNWYWDDDDGAGCPILAAIAPDACPTATKDLDIAPCDTPGLASGALCEGDGECGTDRNLNNCNNKDIEGADMYVVVEAYKPPSGGPVNTRCDNKCAWARDGVCDDERTNPGLCALGSDCQDCGPIGASNFSLGGGASDDDAWWDDEPSYWGDDDYQWDDYYDYQPTKAPTTVEKPAEKPTNQGRGSSKSSKGKAALQPWIIALIGVGFAVTFVGGLAMGVACSRRRSRAAKPAEVVVVSLPEKPTTENPPAAPPAIATPVATRNPFDSPPTAVVVHAESSPAYPAGSPPPYQPPRPSDV